MNQRRLIATGSALLASAILAACGSMGGKPSTAVELVPTAAITPNPTRGTVTFTALDHGVRVAGEVRGLVPGSEHGFHIHEKGDCGDNGNASGGHFNPTGGTHGKFGAPGSHAGELPSLRADSSGVARFSLEDHSISLTPGAANSVIGRALVVHRDPDDFTTQPSGNSGPRIACAVIGKP
ncbi:MULTISPECIES: superoxide dismutase family protein [Variovorax]|jgi:Cu-Zn family superoxide dismutase|uniref:superoxide dismutase family protein n=1 Tax=Variovorax TaxID=34072 RepID=UPI00038282E5|nr:MULTISPECIES: superoxide dismutase family protein [Variovorax]MBB3639462.1 Cu-Zn family superoxide dismutase [Variovorax sp. BK613]MDR6521976.1 Cu-Zn family superoxide dismutase [Variovorax paradoxus]